MESVCGFDDDLFEEEREKKAAAPISYNAKFCEHLWFYETEGANEDEYTQIMKQRADWAYRKGDHKMAVDAYQICLGLIAANSLSLRRDMVESVIRCQLALGQLNEALEMAKQNHLEAINYEHKSNTLQVLLKVYQRMANWQGALGCLQRCIILHPQNSNYWMQLADIYANIPTGHKTSLPHAASDRINSTAVEHCRNPDVKSMPAVDKVLADEERAPPCENCDVTSGGNVSNHILCVDGALPNGDVLPEAPSDDFVSEKLNRLRMDSVASNSCMPVATCLIRAKLLLKISRFGLTKFGKDRNDRVINQLDDKLKEQPISEDDVNSCIAFMQKDIFGEDEGATSTSEDTSKSEKVIDEEDSAVNQHFVDRWLSWR